VSAAGFGTSCANEAESRGMKRLLLFSVLLVFGLMPVFARLSEVFGLKRLNAHSHWGQVTRLAAKMAAYNIGILFNRWLG
jgi:hypothetical protein